MTMTNGTAEAAAPPVDAPTGRGWAVAGLVSGMAGLVSIVASSLADGVYDTTVAGDAPGIVDRLADQVPQILVMHTAAMTSALLLLVFAPGLRRFIATRVPHGSLVPDVAAGGLMLASVAQLMGSALTTEFVSGLNDPEQMVPETAVFFGHWIGTVPWLWAGAGASALALGRAGRQFGVVPAWLAWTSLVLGALTTLLSISPLQYLAGMTGPLWLTLAAIGLLRTAALTGDPAPGATGARR
ncbi:hypothetical protein [Nocardioides astragali]|uniref:DUF4386 domain-containing protein n=1 Tax=Nocardioides astragali TaxID=1776736 RepID=A0ABW2NC98_9ACTN|nr:hypothetical protein [Nocardioides astragali]